MSALRDFNRDAMNKPQKADKLTTMREAIAAYVGDGCSLAIEGFTGFISFAAGHEIIRQKRQGLTLIRMTPDLIYDQMIAAGTAKKLIFSYMGNPGVGSLYCVRRAVEKSIPRPAGMGGVFALRVGGALCGGSVAGAVFSAAQLYRLGNAGGQSADQIDRRSLRHWQDRGGAAAQSRRGDSPRSARGPARQHATVGPAGHAKRSGVCRQACDHRGGRNRR